MMPMSASGPVAFAALSLFALGGTLLAGPLSAGEFRPLFDGKSLAGWHVQGSGGWKVADGMLIGTHAQDDPVFGHLVTDSAYGDFTLRFRWKLVKGNSGLYFRSSEGGEAGMIGPQVEMDGAFPGGIYTTNTSPWGWVVQPKSGDIGKWYRAGDWNAVTVTAEGPKVTVAYNGMITAETSDARLPLRGRFGFQVHRDLECEIWFDDVEIALPEAVPTGLAASGRTGRSPGKPAGAGSASGRYWSPDGSGIAFGLGAPDGSPDRLFQADGTETRWRGPAIALPAGSR